MRVDWIDIAKAIALILIIFIHSCRGDDVISIVLTGFVIPVFFIFYGLTHNRRYRHDMMSYTVSRFKSLMIPYILLTIVMLILYSICYPYIDMGLTPDEYLFWVIYGYGPIQRVSHLWFLRTMFFAAIIFVVVDRYLADGLPRIVLIAVLPQMSVMTKSLFVGGVIWGIDSIFIALAFMMIGSMIRQIRELREWSRDRLFDALTVTISTMALVVLSLYNGWVNIGASDYGSSVSIYMITGVLGTYIVSNISYHICKVFPSVSGALIKFNRNGQDIYEIHPLFIEINTSFISGIPIIGHVISAINFMTGTILSWLISDRIIENNKILRLMFRGRYQEQT